MGGRGRSGAVWRRLSANQRAKGLGCHRCGQPIDYTLKWPDPQSYSTGHRISIQERPDLAEDPDNLVSEHLGCNWHGGTTISEPFDNGTASERW